MKVELESTDQIAELVVDGKTVPARIWQGKTATGVPCHAYITRIACPSDADNSQFERELQEHAPPDPARGPWDLRLFID